MFGYELNGEDWLRIWLALFVTTGIVAGIWTGFLKARKIQPNGFKWKVFRFEIMIAVLTLAVAAPVLQFINGALTRGGFISFAEGPASWWIIALEYAASFFLFDTYFYWLHRWMHKEPFYRLIHKVHHKSTAPNLLTTLSVHPLESLINGGFVPIFVTLFTVHDATMALIVPTNVLMGLYVHSGYEFFPRWWNKSWATKWFITTTFHDQHHKYFNWNFGGYTTIWDRLCGTMRPKFEVDFDKARNARALEPADGNEVAVG